jgi:hypothetical protein
MSTHTGDPKTLTASYTGTDKVTVQIQANGNARLYDVSIRYRGAEPTPGVNTIFQWYAAFDNDLADIATNGNRTINGKPVVVVGAPAVAVTTPVDAIGYKLNNNRLVIGSSSTTATTGDDGKEGVDGEGKPYPPLVVGVLDLSRKFKVTIGYSSCEGATFQMTVNNNTSSEPNAPFAVDGQSHKNRIWNGEESPFGGTITVTVDPNQARFIVESAPDAGSAINEIGFSDGFKEYLKTGFLALRADSGTTIVINSIVIEYVTN